MIRDLVAVLDPADRTTLRTAVGWIVADAVLQGIGVCLLVPFLRELLTGDTAAAARWLAVLAIVCVLAMVAHHGQAMRGFTLALAILRTLRDRLGEHVVRLPLGWFTGAHTGELSRIGSTGVMSVCMSIAHLLQPLIQGVTTPAVVAIVLLATDWRLGLVAIVGAPVLWCCFRFSARMLEGSDLMAHAAADRANAAVLEFAHCQPALRASGRTGADEPYAPLEEALDARYAASRRQLTMTLPGMVVTGFALQAIYSTVIVVGIALSVAGQVEAVVLIAILALMARFIGPLALVSELSGGMRMARNDLRRLRTVLETSPIPEPESPAAASRGGIALDHVDFGYDDELVLRDVSMRAEPGQITAVVGPSGAGKSTVTRVVARFWDVTSGSVSVGGADVRDHGTADLMDQLALVFQDVYLFDDTLAANIALGRPDATDDEVRHAAALAGVDEIVDRLPAGWDTRVGEGGTRLSGGERQRVSIARALLKQAPIVLLDEATAALDPQSEHLVRRSVRELADSGATVLVVAHTPAMISLADHVVVLESGRVAEQGTVEHLMAADGVFAGLFREREQASRWRIGSPTLSGW